MQLDIRGFSIAEGDVVVTTIGLFSELLLGRYTLPSPPDSPLASHAAGVITRCKALLADAGGHRSATYASHVLPQCELGVRALGNAHALGAARAAGVASGVVGSGVLRAEPRADGGLGVAGTLVEERCDAAEVAEVLLEEEPEEEGSIGQGRSIGNVQPKSGFGRVAVQRVQLQLLPTLPSSARVYFSILLPPPPTARER